MADDPLAQYRKTRPAAPAEAVSPPKEADVYLAFGTKDKNRRLRIRCAMDSTYAPAYNVLLSVTYDGTYGTNFALVYSVMMVLVRGKNLQKMIFAIENDLADYIQEFDPDRWQKPTDANAAFIESIQVKVLDGGKAAPDADEAG